MGYFYTEDELAHHGILGQKWGVRRFETEGGHLTALGKKRYDGNPVTEKEKKQFADAQNNLSKAKDEYKKASKKYQETFENSDKAKFNKAAGMYDLRKRQAKNAKAQIEMNHRSKEAGKREKALIEKYKQDGLNQQEAELKAYRQAKLEKALIAAGAVTAVAAAAYGAKKYHDYVTDEVLKAGSIKMKRITSDSSSDLHDTFYAAFGKRDPSKYIGLYGFAKSSNGETIHQKTIDVVKDLKIASDKNAKETMAEVLNKATSGDKKEILESLRTQRTRILLAGGVKQASALQKGIKAIENGKFNTKAAYDALNINMTGGNNAKVFQDFKDSLRDKGYSGIKDRNDNSYSGYAAKTARIIFDTSKVKVSDVRKVSDAEIGAKNTKEMLALLGRQLAPQAALTVAATSALKSQQAKQRDNTAIQKYKKDHPGTKLSNDEILENYYGGKK